MVENSSNNTAQSEAPSDNWFPDDKLDRKQCADFLSSYLTKRYALASSKDKPDTLVLNIRADWGFGKTFFLTRWAKDQQINYPVVYFDAWANDFTDDPLVAFIAEIDKQLGDYFSHIDAVKINVDGMIAKGKRLIKPVSYGIASVIAQKISGYDIEDLKAFLEDEDDNSDDEKNSKENNSAINKEISTLASLALKEHLSKKQAITVFKKRIERLVNSIKQEAAGKQLPIFIFVDELDRCRPTYAIELLEAIKHLFGVPGIYFVVATNLEQLGHSIKAVYGEQFDSERYLKRFFDQEYLLPEPDHRLFIRYLFEKYSIINIRNGYCPCNEDKENGLTQEQVLFCAFVDEFGLNLRDQEQVMLSLHAVLLNWPESETVQYAYLIFLISVKQRSSMIFDQISNCKYTPGDFPSKIGPISKNTVIFTREFQNNTTWKTERITLALINIIHHYYKRVQMPVSKIRDLTGEKGFLNEIDNQIKSICPSNWQYNGLSPLASYAERVRSVGQLSLIKK